MPSINGIRAFIETHDGPLPELGHGEFSGGKSCYIPAQSGQQFWLHYIIHKSLPCKAISVEFYVDGQRIDAQFPMARKYIEYPTVGPVNSTIKSQYGRGTGNEGEEVAWRREVFFTLIKSNNFIKACCATKSPSDSGFSECGTIDCKVFRSERSPEWAGAVTPDEFLTPSGITKSLKRRHVSHVSRLGVKMEARSAKRFCVKSLDPDNAPFAWFKFYYRSRSRLMQKFKLDSFPEVLLPSRDQDRWVSRSRMCINFAKPQLPAHIEGNGGLQASASCVAREDRESNSLDGIIQQLEEELATAETGASEQKDKIIACHQKIDRLRSNSKKLRGRSIQLITGSNLVDTTEEAT